MTQFELVIHTLKELLMDYELVEHPAVFTTAEADRYIEGVPGVRTKSMFLTNRKKNAFLLLIMDDAKRLDFHQVETLTGIKHLKMASAELLKDKLGLEPGMVSVFGLLNNQDKDVQVFLDGDMMEEARMSFHPNVNTSTIFVSTADVMRFIEQMGNPVNILNLE